jgi:hypothetical protein
MERREALYWEAWPRVAERGWFTPTLPTGGNAGVGLVHFLYAPHKLALPHRFFLPPLRLAC